MTIDGVKRGRTDLQSPIDRSSRTSSARRSAGRRTTFNVGPRRLARLLGKASFV